MAAPFHFIQTLQSQNYQFFLVPNLVFIIILIYSFLLCSPAVFHLFRSSLSLSLGVYLCLYLSFSSFFVQAFDPSLSLLISDISLSLNPTL